MFLKKFKSIEEALESLEKRIGDGFGEFGDVGDDMFCLTYKEVSLTNKIRAIDRKLNMLMEYLGLEIVTEDEIPEKTILNKKKTTKKK